MLTLNARNRRLDDILQDISIGLSIDKMAIYLHTNYYSQDINFCNFCFSGINSGLGTVNIKECNRNLGILIKMRGESFPNILLFARYGFLQFLPIFGTKGGPGSFNIENYNRNVVILVRIRDELPPYDLPLSRYAIFVVLSHFQPFLQKFPLFGINGGLGNFDIVNHSRNVIILVKMRGESLPYDLPLSRYAIFVVLSHFQPLVCKNCPFLAEMVALATSILKITMRMWLFWLK